MAYSALARRLLISCPGDVPVTDLSLVQKTINRWNGVYGEQFGTVIIPISWGTHAAAEFGDAPQQILNKQLVDRCDMCLAMFANRLGTPTASADSGTTEEIARLNESGRYVGVLRSKRAATGIDPDQLKSLEEYLKTLKARALVLDYTGDADLIQNVDNFLVAAVSHDQGRTELQLQQAVAGESPIRQAEVWPRVDSVYNPVVFSGAGRTIPRYDWYLVLSNTGDAPARDVQVRLSADDGSDIPWTTFGFKSGGEPHIDVLAPHGETRFQIIVLVETPRQMNCTVSWSGESGRQENTATVRLVLAVATSFR
jgi:hypothetical protein